MVSLCPCPLLMQARKVMAKMRHHLDGNKIILEARVSHVSIKHPLHGRHVIAPACDGRIICLAA